MSNIGSQLRGLCIHSYMDAQRHRPNSKLCHNTYLMDDTSESTRVMYHGNPIITYYSDGSAKVSACGWFTSTTKTRIAALLPNGWSLFQKDYQWYLKYGDHPPLAFRSGTLLWSNGLFALPPDTSVCAGRGRQLDLL